MKVLGGIAVFAVCLQGLLGGLTVKYLLPTPISVAHACLAQTFFCLTLAIAIFTSRSWEYGRSLLVAPTSPRPAGHPSPGGEGRARGNFPSVGHERPPVLLCEARGRDSEAGSRSASQIRVSRWAVACFAVLYVQLILGAWMRHSAAGLAIPDFPASFGGLVPDHWNSKIAIHFAHRAWAIVVAATVFTTVSVVLRRSASVGARRAARLLAILLPVQVLLGAISIWTRKAVPATVAHQTLGAALLACAAGMAIFVFREAFLQRLTSSAVPSRVAAGAGR
jgi:heme A synthase